MILPLHDDNPTTTKPYVTVGIMIACTLVYVLTLVGAQRASYLLGVVPAVLTGHLSFEPGMLHLPPYATVFTSMFMHGGFWHLAGNMLYLWIFGNNIEDAMGHVRFFLFYALCGAAAVFAQVLPNPVSETPMIGASGAISAVVGAYALLFNQNQIRAIGPIPASVIRIAWLAAAWIGVQALFGLIYPHIAIAAHIGGFLAGLALGRPLLLWHYRKA